MNNKDNMEPIQQQTSAEEIVIRNEAKHNSGRKKEYLKQRAYLNSLTSLIDYGATQITGFIISPFIVSGLGNIFFGIWQMLGQMTGYVQIGDARASQALKWSIARKRAIADDEELRSDATTALVVITLMLPIVFIAGGFITWYSPQITGAAPEYFKMIRCTSALLILSLIINQMFDLFESILRGMNLVYKRMGFRAVIIIVGGGLKVAAIYFGYGLIGLSIVQVFIALITGLTFFYVVKKSVGWFGFGKTNLKNVLNFGKTSVWFMAWTGVNTLLSNSDKILLGYIAGPALVTTYALTKFTFLTMQGLITSTIHGVMPGFGSIIASEENEMKSKTRSQIMTFTWLVSTSLAAAILMLNESFLGLWVGSDHFAGQKASFLIGIMIIQYIFVNNDAVIINLSLDLKMKVYLAMAAVGTNILLAFLLIPKYKIIGLCISVIAGRMFMTVGFPMIVRKKIIKSSYYHSNSLPKQLLISLMLFIVAIYLGKLIHINSWFILFATAPIAFLCGMLPCWFLGINNDQRNEFRVIIQKIKFTKLNYK